MSGLTDEQRQRLDRKKASRQNKRTDDLQIEVDRLIEQLELAESRLSEVESERDEALQNLTIAEENVQQAAEFGSQLIEQVNNLEAENGELQQTIKQRESDDLGQKNHAALQLSDGDADLREQLQMLETEKLDITAELEASQEKVHKMLQSQHNLQRDNEKLRKMIADIDEEQGDEMALHELRKESAKKTRNLQAREDTKIEQMEDVVTQREQDLATAQARIRVLEKEKNRLDGAIAQSNDGKEDLLDQIRTLTKEAESNRSEMNNLRQQLERQLLESNAKYDELDKKSKHLRVTLMTRFSEAQHKHEDEKENLLERLEDLRQELREAQKGDQTDGHAEVSLGSELNAALSVQSNAKKSQETIEAQKKEIATLSVELAALRQEEQRLSHALQQATRDNEHLDSKVNDQLTQLSVLSTQLEDANKAQTDQIHEMQRVQNDKRVLQNNCDNLAEKCRMLEDRIAVLGKDMGDLKAERETSTSKVAELQDAVHELSAQLERDVGVKLVEIKRLEKKVTDSEESLRKNNELNSAKLDNAESTKMELRAQIDVLNATIGEQRAIHQRTAKETNSALKQATDELQDTKAKHQLLISAYAEVEAAMEAAAAQVSSYVEEIAELKRVDARRADALAQMTTQVDELTAVRTALAEKDGEITKLRNALDNAVQTSTNTDSQRAKLERELEQAREASMQLSASFDSEKERLVALTAELKVLKEQKTKSDSELQHLQLHVQNMEATEQRLQAQLASLRAGDEHSVPAAKLQQLRTTIDTYRAELAEQELLAKEMEQRLEEMIHDQADELREKDEMIGKVTDEMQNILQKAQGMQEDFAKEAQQTKEYKGKVGVLVDENVAFSNQLAAATAAASDNMNQLQLLAKEHDDFKKWVKDLEVQLQKERKDTGRTKAELRSAHKIITELKHKEETLHGQIDQLKIDLEDALDRSAALEDDIATIRTSAQATVEKKAADADAANDALMQVVDEHIIKAEEAEFELQLRTDELEVLKSKHEQEMAKAKSARDGDRQELQRLSDDKRQVEEQLAAALRNATTLEFQIGNSEKRLHVLQQEHDMAVAQHQTRDADARSTISRMTAELDGTTTQNSELKEALSARKTRVTELEAALQQTQEALAAARRDSAARAEEIADLQTENSGLLEEVNTLMVLNSDLVQEGVAKDEAYDEKDTQREETLNALEAQVRSLTLDLEYERQRADATQDAADSGAREQLTALQETHAALQRSHARLKDEHRAMSTENGELLDEVNDLISVNRELNEDVQNLKEAMLVHDVLASATTPGLAGLQSLSAADIRTQELEDEVKKLHRELGQMKATETQLKHDLRQKEHSLQSCAHELADVRTDLDDRTKRFEKKIEEMGDELSKFLQLNVELTQQLNTSTEEDQAASPENATLSADAQTDITSLHQRIEQLKLEQDAVTAKLTEANDANAALQVTLRETEHKLLAAKKEADSRVQEVNDLMMFMSEINRELATLKHSRQGLEVVKQGLGLGANVDGEVLKADLTETQLQLKKQADEIDRLQAEVATHQQSFKDLDDRHKKEKRDQAQKFVDLEDQIGQLEVENDELVDMVKELNEKLSEYKNEAAQGVSTGPMSMHKTLVAESALTDASNEHLEMIAQNEREISFLKSKVEDAELLVKEVRLQLSTASGATTKARIALEKEQNAHEKTKKKLKAVSADGSKLSCTDGDDSSGASSTKPKDARAFFERFQGKKPAVGTTKSN
eukprot:m.602656 g.602656  ORF g.602656 m.602656 type:complete len:1726 (-) comp22449_c0_seq2:882-6059(-)